ncbi:MAG: F0F1 ATP synthase subunit B [Candidatus Cyclobacteriaceae bacterium M2_1C_046]
MELLTPGTGLIVWQTIVFLILLFLLSKFAWKPIMNSLKIREASIQEALDSAAAARDVMSKLKAENEKLLDEARAERDKMLNEARNVANSIKEEAKVDASATADKIVADAREAIKTEKEAAMADVRAQIAAFALEISEKLLRENLSDDKSQQALVEKYVKELNIN